MNVRIFSKKHGIYTDDPAWPSNQRTWSEWAITPEGAILEIIDDGSGPFVEKHDPRNFIVYPWTGFFDKNGAKIFAGDIIQLECFRIDYEVVWNYDRFSIKDMGETIGKFNDGIYSFPTQKDLSEHYIIIGNIHNNETP